MVISVATDVGEGEDGSERSAGEGPLKDVFVLPSALVFQEHFRSALHVLG